MMNYIWTGIILLSVVCAAVYGKMPELTSSVIQGGADAVTLCIKLLGMLCLWSGLAEIAEKSGLCEKIEKLLNPLLSLIFPKLRGNREIKSAISMNITANLLGLGNAATPLGITAMKKLQGINGDKNTASDEMIAFVVMNTAAIRLLPTTVGALRSAAGAEKPMDIIVCTWISSLFSVIAAVAAVKIAGRVIKK